MLPLRCAPWHSVQDVDMVLPFVNFGWRFPLCGATLSELWQSRQRAVPFSSLRREPALPFELCMSWHEVQSTVPPSMYALTPVTFLSVVWLPKAGPNGTPTGWLSFPGASAELCLTWLDKRLLWQSTHIALAELSSRRYGWPISA